MGRKRRIAAGRKGREAIRDYGPKDRKGTTDRMGTTDRKGPQTDEKPYRYSYIIEVTLQNQILQF
jgi:hypothetical protein